MKMRFVHSSGFFMFTAFNHITHSILYFINEGKVAKLSENSGKIEVEYTSFPVRTKRIILFFFMMSNLP